MVKACRRLLIALISVLFCVSAAQAYFAVTNSTDHTEIHIVPAPGKVAIDGDLTDWDLSGAILMKLDESSKAIYSVRGALMYDADALYIGAHVKDPTPMVNNYAFTDEPGMAWNADAVQLRFISDPAIKTVASVQSGGFGITPEQEKNVCHMTLWYSTRDRKAGFSISYTLNFADGKLNPPDVQGAYLPDADGKGYSFEYRVPWAVLRAPRALRGGDQVQCQWQLHWGLDVGQGLKFGMTDVRNPASGDLGYMGPGSWGMGIVEKTGHISIVEKGAVERPQGHVPIKFTLAKDGKVSLAVYDAAGQLVRTCLGAEPFTAGAHTYLWDGLDDKDQPLPAGKYSYKLLTHGGITQQFVCDVGTSGTPPYQNEDGTGGWAGDYRAPCYVATDGDHVVLGTGSAEAAPATIATDLAGTKRYGTAAYGGALALYRGYGYFVQQGNGKLVKFELAKGYLSAFADGKAEVTIAQKRPDETNDAWVARAWTMNALSVAHGDTLVISCTSANKLLLVALATGAVTGEIDVPAPVGVATAPDGTLYVVSGKAVGRFDIATKQFTPIVAELDEPAQLACDAQGNIYVSLRGTTQQVWKLSPAGQVLQKFGRVGGRPALGKFDPSGLLNPWGIAVDKNGRLWVAEADNQPKRYSTWNADGTLYKDFFGSIDYASRGWVDPADPRYVYLQNTRYLVDYDTGAWQVDGCYFRAGKDGKVSFDDPGSHAGGTVIHFQGRKFIWFRAAHGLYEEVNGRLAPRMALGPQTWWVDGNNDGKVQDDELLAPPAAGKFNFIFFGATMDNKLNLYSYQGVTWHGQGGAHTDEPFKIVRWDCLGFNANGGLKYADPQNPTVVATDTTGGAVSDVTADDEGNVYALVSGGTLERGARAQGSGHRVVKYTADGKRCWDYQNVHCAFAWTAENYFPGYLVGACGFSSGNTKDFLAVTGYYGQYFLLDKKTGLFVDALGEDQRSPYTLGQHMVLTENFNGSIFQHPGNGNVYFLGGDADQRLWKLNGVGKITHADGTLPVSAAMAAKAQQNARLVRAAELAKGGSTAVVKRLNGAAADGKYDEWNGVKTLPIVMDATRSALAQLGYDAQNLYVRFQVQDDSPLCNTPTDYKLLIKSGDAVELQLGIDNTRRTATAAGDIRLLISRTAEGAMVATLYRPKTTEADKPNKAHFGSPTGGEDYDEVIAWNDLPMHCLADKDGYVVEVAVPWARLAITPTAGMNLTGDVGVIYGNKGGTRNAIRYLWSDKSPEVSINNDIPSEVRIHPGQWGKLILQ